METETKSEQNKLSIPMAIIIVGVLIAGSIYFSSIRRSDTALLNQPSERDNANLENIRAISETDHIRGNIDAPVKIVEYSDTECPFCKMFHTTMKRVIEEYGGDRVAWIYRHSPIDSLHPKARKEAMATECANELGGNEKFWMYLDRIYDLTPSNNGLDPAELPKIAEYVGLNVTDFNSCLDSGIYAERIEEDLQNANATGGKGTPWSIIIAKNGEKYPINGAEPYETVRQMIDFSLQ